MALYPNNLRTASGWIQTRQLGRPHLYTYSTAPGQRRNIFTGAIPKTSSVPEGYATHGALVQPYVAGAMGAVRPTIELSGSGDALAGGPMEGTGTVALTADDGNLSLIVALDGTATLTLSSGGVDLKLTVGMDGTGSITLTGDASNLAMIVPFEGAGGITLAGTSDLRGRLSLEGDFNLPAEFSAEALASAVWDAEAANYGTAGTMGEKVNDAGSASNPWTEVIESGFTAAEILRMIAAVVQGNATGLENGAPDFKGLDGTTTRVQATYVNGVRTVTSRDGS